MAKKEVKECCVEMPKQKSRLTISSEDAPSLKGKAVGANCEVTVSGKIVEARIPSDFEKPAKGEIRFVVEIDKVENKSKRI
jgi:hypothetical protein